MFRNRFHELPYISLRQYRWLVRDWMAEAGTTTNVHCDPALVPYFAFWGGSKRAILRAAASWDFDPRAIEDWFCTHFWALKCLEDMIEISIVQWFLGPNGWTFARGDGSTRILHARLPNLISRGE